MKTYLDCVPCFFKQILYTCKIITTPLKKQKNILNEFAKKIPEISYNLPPPEIASIAHSILKKITGNQDPYKKIKQKSNQLVLRFISQLKNKVLNSRDALLTAIKLAIAGNIIDFGINNNLNIKKEIKKVIAGKYNKVNKKLFHYHEFKYVLKRAKSILYLADNAGEIVFDRILIEEIKKIYPNKKIYFAVKEKPIINDALIEDALVCKIDRVADIISSGSNAPGTILKLCSKDFKKIYRKVDMIISKGQGNFESLTSRKPTFYMFMVKCQVVANETDCKIGDMVLLYNQKK